MNKKQCEKCEKGWVNREVQGELWLEVCFVPEKACMTIKAKNSDLRKNSDFIVQNYHMRYCPWCGRKLD